MTASDGIFSFSLSSLAVDFCGMNLLSYSHYPFLGYHGIFLELFNFPTQHFRGRLGFFRREFTLLLRAYEVFIFGKEGNPSLKNKCFPSIFSQSSHDLWSWLEGSCAFCKFLGWGFAFSLMVFSSPKHQTYDEFLCSLIS